MVAAGNACGVGLGRGAGARDVVSNRLIGGEVGLDRLLPHAQGGEDVRRHMERMRRRRRQRRISPRRRQPFHRDRRVVVGVNDVMHDSGMIGLCRLQLFEDASGFQLTRVGLVAEVDGFEQRKRVEHGRFAVGRVALVQPRHGGGVAFGPHLLVDRPVPLEERRQRVDPVALPLCARIRGAGVLDGLPALLQQLRWERRRERIWPLADGDSPVRHGARRLALGDGAKRLLRFGIEERVQHRDAAVELFLRPGAARRLEVHRAENAGASVIVILRRQAALTERAQRNCDDQ